MNDEIPKEDASKPLVSVWMATYNHAQFIGEALQSVLDQKTDFAFEIVIGEDCSTDNTREILKQFEAKYPGIVKPVYHQVNVGAYRNSYEFVYPQLKGEYIACLEADDYWTDEHKLQKQVDFLRSTSNYSICWTKYKILQEGRPDTHKLLLPDWLPFISGKPYLHIDLNNVFNPYSTMTLTAVFRRSAFDYSLLQHLKFIKDNTLYCLCLSRGNGAVLNFFGAVYRTHAGGTYSSLQLYNQRYSSFLNLEEIVSVIPGCNNPHLRSIRNVLLLECFNLSLNKDSEIHEGKSNAGLYTLVLKYATPAKKAKATLQLSKHLLRRLTRLFTTGNSRKRLVTN